MRIIETILLNVTSSIFMEAFAPLLKILISYLPNLLELMHMLGNGFLNSMPPILW
jgi:hypothetical protein